MRNSRGLLLFVIKTGKTVRPVFLSLLFFFATFFWCDAGLLFGVTPLPNESQFTISKSKSLLILKALFFEKAGRYKKAARYWRSLPQENDLVQEHLFISEFTSNVMSQSDEIPASEKSRLLLARYLSWQKGWGEALELLKSGNEKELSNEIRLEMIRLYLFLGYYNEAGALIEQSFLLSHRQKMQNAVFHIWLYILQGKPDKAKDLIKRFEENFLYLPISTTIPESEQYYGSDLELILEESLLRFPSNEAIFERLLNRYKHNGQWEKILTLVKSQKYLSSQPVSWYLLSEAYLNLDDFDRLESHLNSNTGYVTTSEYYDFIAQLAIKQKNWLLLLNAAKVLQDRFPKLADGKLYEIIYLKETGREEEGNQMFNKMIRNGEI